MREAVLEFANAMEAKLQKHEMKGGWRKVPVWLLDQRLQEEKLELSQAIISGTPEQAAEECLDVANFAMFIYDNLMKGYLSEKEHQE